MEDANISISDFIDTLKRRKWAILISFLFVLSVAVAVSMLLPPIYKSTATILIEEQEIPVDYVMTTVTSFAEQRLQIINQRIMSTSRLQDIIDRFELYADLREKKSKEEIIEIMREDIHLETIDVEVMDRRTGRPTSATIAFTLSYEGKNDPVKVQRVANVLASFYLEENLKVREKQVTEASEFFEDELNKVKTALDDIENKIASFKQRHVNALPELMPVLMQNKHNVDISLERLGEQLRNLKERESVLLAELAGTKPMVDYDKSELEAMKIRLAELKTVYTDAYPDVQKLRSTIAELEQNKKIGTKTAAIQNDPPDNPAYISITSQLASVQTDLETIQAEHEQLEQEKKQIEERIASIPINEKKYSSLENERRNAQRKYDDLTAKFMEAKVAQGLEQEQKGERFTLIDPPIIPEKPYKPNRLAILFIGLVLGLGAGAGVAALREFSDDAVRNLELLQQRTALPVLAVIPEIIPPKEQKSRRRRKITTALVIFILLAGGAVAFHYLVMDYQILWIKLSRHMGL